MLSFDLKKSLTVLPVLAFAGLFYEWNIYSWALSDLHINYSTGLVRRGFLGAIALYLERSLSVEPADFFRIVFATAYGAQIFLFHRLLKPWPASDVWLLVLLSPALLLFPYYDAAAFLRKDVLVSVGFLIHACVWMTSARYERFVVWMLLPWLAISTLIYEVQIFFLGFHALLIWQKSGRKVLAASILAVPSAIGALPLISNVSPAEAIEICQAWKSPPSCVSIEALAWPVEIAIRANAYYLAKPFRMFFMALLLIVALLPCVLVIHRAEPSFHSRLRNHGPQLLFAYLMCVPLFIVGYDWGRWMHLLAIHTIALMLVTLQPRRDKVLDPLPVRATLLVLMALYVAAWRLPSAGISWGAVVEGSLINRLGWRLAMLLQ